METNQSDTVTIHVMGKKHTVPADLTIMKAMEAAGHQFKRGAGCRGGFCGACATIYRTKGSYKLQGALACQKIVEDGMYIAQIPFSPAEKKTYDIGELRPDASTFLEYYPEIARCLSCNTCTKACPQDIEVMDYVQAALRGDVEEAEAQLRLPQLRPLRGEMPRRDRAIQHRPARAEAVQQVHRGHHGSRPQARRGGGGRRLRRGHR